MQIHIEVIDKTMSHSIARDEKTFKCNNCRKVVKLGKSETRSLHIAECLKTSQHGKKVSVKNMIDYL